jgi:hypothetical protein
VDRGRVFCGNRILTVGHGLIQPVVNYWCWCVDRGRVFCGNRMLTVGTV